MEKKVYVVTGANSGIGKVTAKEIAKTGNKVVMVCRDRIRGEKALKEIKEDTGNDDLVLMLCDLSSFESIKMFYIEFKNKIGSLDCLVNNAGCMMRERKLTIDGYESHIQINYLGTVLLTNLLINVMNPNSRIINVSSVAHTFGKIHFNDINIENNFSMFKAYGQSKLAIILYSYELAKRLVSKNITVNCLHPGVIISNLGIYTERKVIHFLTQKLKGLFSSVEKGAETSVYLALSKEVEGVTGKYFYHKKIKKTSKKSYDKDLSIKLWNYTESILNEISVNQISA